ncbi:MAG: protease-like activity factor CPAF [Waddliaceae bacterium]
MIKVNKFILKTIFLLTPILGYSQTSQQEIKDKMVADLEIIKKTFEVKYAPAEWKKEYTNWDLEEKMNLAKVKVLDSPGISIKDFQRIVLDFFNSTKDYHVGVSFYSTEAAFLPFRVHSAKGKYFVAWVSNQYFAGLKNPMKKGDEVLLFNGRPVDEVVQELKKSDFGNPLSATDQALAEAALTMRLGSAGNIVSKGPVKVTVRHAGTNKKQTYRLNWFYLPEEISSHVSPLIAAAECKLLASNGNNYRQRGPRNKPLGEYSFFYKDMTAPLFNNYKTALFRRDQALYSHNNSEMLRNDEEEDDDFFIGAKKSFIPTLGKVTWEASEDNPFHAYIYISPEGKRIGYIRIPNYLAGKQSVEKFAEIMNLFEQQTEALVVDQVSNPGGNLFYMYALASALSDSPLVVPKQRMTITQEDVYFALDYQHDLENVRNDQDAVDVIGSNIGGYPVDFEFAQCMLKYFRFIVSEWNEGRAFTNPDYLYGLEYLQPHPKGHYSKPILLLVNQLDFSCGDFLPAILQDNARTTILGTKTAGAGGYVLSHCYPNLFGIWGYSFTGSIAQRVDLNPIENLGITPDIEAEMTTRDLEGNYQDYLLEIHKAVSKILPK